MSSMNNWLAFSLSPQHQHQDENHHSSIHGFNNEDISGANDECFDLSNSSSAPPPPPISHPYDDAIDDASPSFNNRNNNNGTN